MHRLRQSQVHEQTGAQFTSGKEKILSVKSHSKNLYTLGKPKC